MTEAGGLLYYDGAFAELAARRMDVGAVHGTGCTFASAIAAGLALGDEIPAAVERAKRYITGAIEHSVDIGHGARSRRDWRPRGSPGGTWRLPEAVSSAAAAMMSAALLLSPLSASARRCDDKPPETLMSLYRKSAAIHIGRFERLSARLA